MTGRYYTNPKRGCGTKKHDAYYAEGSRLLGGKGHLWAWTWLLGDGVDDFLFLRYPPRGMITINPAATIATRENILDQPEFVPGNADEQYWYKKMLRGTKVFGVGDHVGANHYTAWDFAKEVGHYGPSRRIPKTLAKMLAEHLRNSGPIPMLFTHGQVPVFESEEQAQDARDVTGEIFPHIEWGNRNYYPTWEHEQWGQYSMYDQYIGQDHWLERVLMVVDYLNWPTNDASKDKEVISEAQEFFGNLRYQEQAIGLSWLTMVTYTLPKDAGEEDAENAAREIPGLNILDLDNTPEYIDYEMEEYDE